MELLKKTMQNSKPILQNVFSSIDDFKKQYNNTVLDDIVERWSALQFTDGIDDEESKKDLAIAYEQMAAYMLFSYDVNSHDKLLELLIFPTIRKLMINEGLGKKYSSKKVIDAIYGVNLGKLFDRLQFYRPYNEKIDLEAELTVLLTNALKTIILGENENKRLYDLIDEAITFEIANYENTLDKSK